jgi:hypothetical protein
MNNPGAAVEELFEPGGDGGAGSLGRRDRLQTMQDVSARHWIGFP